MSQLEQVPCCQVAGGDIIGHHAVERLVHRIVVDQNRRYLAGDQSPDHLVRKVAAIGEDHAVDLTAHAVEQRLYPILPSFEQLEHDTVTQSLRLGLDALQDLGVKDVSLDRLHQSLTDNGQCMPRLLAPRACALYIAHLAHDAERPRTRFLADPRLPCCNQRDGSERYARGAGDIPHTGTSCGARRVLLLLNVCLHTAALSSLGYTRWRATDRHHPSVMHIQRGIACRTAGDL